MRRASQDRNAERLFLAGFPTFLRSYRLGTPMLRRCVTKTIQRPLHAETAPSYCDMQLDLRSRDIFVAEKFLKNTEGLEVFWKGTK